MEQRFETFGIAYEQGNPSKSHETAEAHQRTDFVQNPGALAEWLGRGLQSPARQFDPGTRLSSDPDLEEVESGPGVFDGQVPVEIHGRLDRRVAHELLDVLDTSPCAE